MAGKPQKIKDMTGMRFGKLVIHSLDRRDRKPRKTKTFWNCICDCGGKKVVEQSYLRQGETTSCGCLFLANRKRIISGEFAIKHGMKGHRFYRIWKGINGRCFTKSNKCFETYGKRGISSVWRYDFLKFKDDMYESYQAHIKHFGEKNTTIDRIDGKLGYSKENCRWATCLEQRHNQERWRSRHDPEKIPMHYHPSLNKK